jgi:hypothetical protein
MRTIILVALALGFVGIDTIDAQQEQAVLRKKLESKLSEKWVSIQNWTTDYNLARQRVAQSGKLIFAYFTRSYAP